MCLYISDKIKYKLRTDLCEANSNYESCFIEVECKTKNIVAGVVYRSHTSIDNFTSDIEPIFKKLNSERKHLYVMGDFNIDLLKADIHRPTHEYLELLYSYSILPTIYKPTRITESTATIIDNILTNNDEDIAPSTILITNVSDHFPTILSANLDLEIPKSSTKKFIYKRINSNENISKLKQKLSDVNWQEKLDNNDVNVDYDKFIEMFDVLYDECIPLKKCTTNRKKDPLSPWITKGLLKSINKKNKLYKYYMENKINAFATSCYRVMLNIKRIDHVLNTTVYSMTNTVPLIHLVRHRQLKFLGHILRMSKEEPARRYALYIPTIGKRRPGRPRTSYLNYVQRLLGDNERAMQEQQIAAFADDRRAWRNLVVACSAADG